MKNILFSNFRFHVVTQSSAGYTDVILQTSGTSSIQFTS